MNVGIIEGRTISSSTLLHFKYPRPFKANRVREKERDEEERDEREFYHTEENHRASERKWEKDRKRARAKRSDRDRERMTGRAAALATHCVIHTHRLSSLPSSPPPVHHGH